MGEKLPCGNQGVVGLTLLDFTDPRVFENPEEEFTYFEFYGLISGEVEDAGVVNDFLPQYQRCILVVLDGHIVDGRFLGHGNAAV